MTALRNYDMHEMKIGKSIYRLSSGKNLASDDPAGMAIAERLRAQLRELSVHIRMTEEMQDMLDCAYGDAMAQQSLLQRMRELSVGMANDTLSKDEKSILATEFAELAKEFGLKTFEKTGMEIVALGVGDKTGELVFKKDDKVFIDGEWKKLSLLEKEHADNGGAATVSTTGLTDYVDSMMKSCLSSASGISAFSSRLSFRLDRLYSEEENAMAALSRIEDVDLAREVTEFVKEHILAQTSLAVGAQANALPEQVLSLFDALPSPT